jgi:hypothetical protein
MPMRGVQIPGLHEQLFAAAERIIARDGFLAEFAVDRARRTEDAVSGLLERAGHRS